MKHRLLLVTLTLMTIASSLMAQRQPMGGWRTHLAYTAINQIAVTSEFVYAVSDGALCSALKRDFAIQTYSKINGLSDNNVARIATVDQLDAVVVAYTNSNIDIIYADGSVENLPDLYRKAMSADKRINNIVAREDVVYLACGFGILAIDLQRFEIVGTYIIGDEANYCNIIDLAYDNDNLYALVDEDIKYIALSNPNPGNYANWHNLGGLPTGTHKSIAVYNNTLYLLEDNGDVYNYNGVTWQKLSYTGIEQMDSYHGVITFSKPGNVHYVMNTKEGDFVYNMPKMVVHDAKTKHFWLASEGEGIGRVADDASTYYFMRPQGPSTNEAWRMVSQGDKLIVVPGGRWATQYLRQGEVMIFENNEWSNIAHSDIAAVTQHSCTDFVDVAIDPQDANHFFVASYGTGLYEFKNNQFFKLHNADGGGVESIYPERRPADDYYMYQRVDGLSFDNEGNLYFVNPETSCAIKYLDKQGKFHQVQHGTLTTYPTLHRTIHSKLNPNLKFVLVPRDHTGVFAFYDNKTPDNTTDDSQLLRTFFYDQDGKKVQPNFIYDMVEDNNGTIWLGTSDGVLLLEKPTNFFKNEYTASRVKVPRNDGTSLADYLLDKSQVNAIAVDGANRKWLATANSGVYLVSENGKEELAHFTSENSPLLSNEVQCIGINQRTGEVFFGTSNGIVSYQSDAADAEEQFNDVHAYPNPLRPSHDGGVTISGLIENTRVKFTDAAGNVVYETISNGSIATWSARLSNGERVASGVYFAICISKDGKQKKIVKILIIK